MFFTIIFVLMATGDGIWWWRADRRLRPLRHPRFWRTMLGLWTGWMIAYLMLACLFPQLIRRSRTPVPTPLHAAVYLWHMLVLPVLAILMFAGSIVGNTLLLFRKLVARPTPAPTNSISEHLTRRELLFAAALTVPPVATMGMVGASLRQLTSPPRIRRIELALPQLPPDLDGMTLAHVTDLHVGKFSRPDLLPGLAEQINSLRADFIVVTGDIIDMALADLPPALDMLQRLDPRHGIFICEGNHDVIEDGEIFETRMWESGLPFLADEARRVSFRGRDVQFLGMRWYRSDAETQRAVRRMQTLLEPETFPILMAHHPHAYDTAAELKFPLVLSGHTHGGQLMLTPNIGAGPALFRYWSGVYHKPGSTLVVSNGVGAWFPLRINAPAEIIHLTLRHTPDLA